VVFRGQEAVDGCVEGRGRQPGLFGDRTFGSQRGDQRGRRLLDVVATLRPRVSDRVEHFTKRRHALHGSRRKVGAGIERRARWGGEHGEGPTQRRGEGARRREIGRIHIGVFFAIDLDRHESGGELGGHLAVAETLASHHMTPVAGRVADRDEHRHVAAGRLGEGLLAPRPPVDGVAGV
jgi:hypothetical protein